jgi:hypothetical protein
MLAHNLGILDRRLFFGTSDNYPGQTMKTQFNGPAGLNVATG